jgi:hypothetical protein
MGTKILNLRRLSLVRPNPPSSRFDGATTARFASSFFQDSDVNNNLLAPKRFREVDNGGFHRELWRVAQLFVR